MSRVWRGGRWVDLPDLPQRKAPKPVPVEVPVLTLPADEPLPEPVFLHALATNELPPGVEIAKPTPKKKAKVKLKELKEKIVKKAPKAKVAPKPEPKLLAKTTKKGKK